MHHQRRRDRIADLLGERAAALERRRRARPDRRGRFTLSQATSATVSAKLRASATIVCAALH
jgi:hypothetical protein